MKKAIVLTLGFLALGGVIPGLSAAPTPAPSISRETVSSMAFPTIEQFKKAIWALEAGATKDAIGSLFTVPEPGQPEDPDTGKPVAAKKIGNCDILWQNEEAAILFASAEPPTRATRSAIGVLLSLKKREGQWQIADLKRFIATGKYAMVAAQKASYTEDRHDSAPIISVSELQGGRGYQYSLSDQYDLSEKGKWQRRELQELPYP